MVIAALSPEDRAAALEGLPLWRFDADRAALFRTIRTADFATAFGLMASIAAIAEAADHHPEWFNVYNRIDIWLTTHAASGVSSRDIALARRIDGLAPGMTDQPSPFG